MLMENPSMHHSNLDCFLHCTTPLVSSQFLPKSEIRSLNRLWHPWERENVEFFRLSDLWKCYHEWSVYGAGVSILLDNGEPLVQYYVPYLSAIQIFTSNPSPLHRECTYSDSCSESCSDESDLWKCDGWSSEEGSGAFEQESHCQLNDRLGYLYCQYFESSTPYARVPLMDKISELGRRYPGLMSLRSVDLSPASWMAVAWYPIYHIPMGRNIKDLSTCFLTYHTLSSSFQDMDHDDDTETCGCVKQKERDGIPLPAFGLVTYKMHGTLWISGRSGGGHDRVMSLSSVADSWLKQLKVQHHDFNFFNGIRCPSN